MRTSSVVTSSNRTRGGCLAKLGVAFLILVVLFCVAAYFTFRWFEGQVIAYTSEQPMALPQVTMTDGELAALDTRVGLFQNALKSGQGPAPTLVLNEKELNTLLLRNPDLKGVVYVSLENSALKGQVSVPLKQIGFPVGGDRYFNGKGTFNVLLGSGILVVNVQELEVNGKPLPDWIMEGLRKENLAQNAMKDPELAADLNQFDSIKVENSRLVITGRNGSN